MRRAWLYSLAYLFPLCVTAGLTIGGPAVFTGVALLVLIIPALDALSGHDEAPPEAEPSALYNLWLRLWCPLQAALIVAVLWRLRSGELSGLEVFGATLSLGAVAGSVGITVAHELMHHRGSRLDLALAELLMASVNYTHFCIEHIHGHHRRVATPEDPASARLGESLFAFLPRSLWGSLRSAWQIEAERCEREGVAAWSLTNRRLRYLLEAAVLALSAWALAGPLGVLVIWGQGAFAALLLEVINYVEHYGLERRRLSSGSYERVQPQHSWSSSHRLTSWILFNLPRHADHHSAASRSYGQLRHLEAGPQLPAGYATMLVLACVPPLWRRVMDVRAQAWRG